MTEDRLRAYLRIHLAENVGAVTFHKLVDAFGDVEAAAAAGSAVKSVPGIGPAKADAIAAVSDADVDAERAAVEQFAARILTCEDADYPPGLEALGPARPAVLYVRGHLAEGDKLAVGVVGARRCTHYGIEQAERFGQLLGRAGISVISGGARGIDTAAHRGALAAGGRTLAVMGCGLCQHYPRENHELFERIVAERVGALISELPMRTSVKSGNFPTRNRIIAALSLGVLVVEAARRSGSLHTARQAIEMNRSVFAVPGRVDSPTSAGTNELIRRCEAALVQDLSDVLDELGQVGQAVDEAAEAEQPALPENLDPAERKLMETLAAGGELPLDDLARRSGLAVGQATACMTMLVLRGLARQKPGNVFLCVRRNWKDRPRVAAE